MANGREVCLPSHQRAAWIPYFKEITALIFLAPLSSFDETLTEDPSINRLEDTFMLWKTICANKLLADVQIVRIHLHRIPRRIIQLLTTNIDSIHE